MPEKQSKKSSLTLKKAREEGKLDQFIKEHEDDAPGDAEKLQATLKRIATEKTITNSAKKKRS